MHESSHAGWTGQSYVPAQRDPALIEKHLSLPAPRTETPIPQQLASMTTGLQALRQCLRDSATSLTPLILAVGGLEPAVSELVRDCPVPVHLDIATQGRLPRPVEESTYQLMRACLDYVADHTGSSRADAYLTSTASLVQFGVETDCPDCFASDGPALAELRAGAAAVGATLLVSRRTQGGLRLRVAIPVARAARNARLPREN